MLCFVALHHGRRAEARAAARPGGVLRGSHASVPRTRRSLRRARLHGILHRTLWRNRPLGTTPRKCTILIYFIDLTPKIILNKLFKNTQAFESPEHTMVFGKPPVRHWAAA